MNSRARVPRLVRGRIAGQVTSNDPSYRAQFASDIDVRMTRARVILPAKGTRRVGAAVVAIGQLNRNKFRYSNRIPRVATVPRTI